jgi:hypothetical protein
MRRFAVLVPVLALCAVLTACGSSSARPKSSKALRTSIVGAALTQHSFHWAYSSAFDLIGGAQRAGDVTADSAVERETLPGGETAEFRFVHETVYLRGGNVAIDELVGLGPPGSSKRVYLIGSSKRAHRYAGKWIAIPKGDNLYSAFAAYLTPATILQQATPQGKLKVSKPTPHGARLLDVTGPEGGSHSDLEARGTGDPLSVSYAWRDFSVDRISMRFSKWNEPLTIAAPKHAVPLATVRKT